MKKPYIFSSRAEVEDKSGFKRIPDIGEWAPKGWEPAPRDEIRQFWPKGVYELGLFTDHSGWGRDYESAMTIGQFQQGVLAALDAGKGYGYGISSVGQFQLHIQVFQKASKRAKR